jgi:hypothetical protein
MTLRKPAALTALLVACLALWAPIVEAVPSRPICVDIHNLQYFRYDGKTIALVGTSAEYLPHVSSWADQNQFAMLQSYQAFINELVAKGLNRMRIWVSLNDSISLPTTLGRPPHETPFCYNPVGTATVYTCDNTGAGMPNKYDLNRWDPVFFTNLRAVIDWAAHGGNTFNTAKAVIVEVVIFDAHAGNFDGPWNPAKNLQGYGFTAESNAIALDTAGGDTVAAHISARAKQKALIRKLVDELKTYHNFYWEIANEPEGQNEAGAASDANGQLAKVVAWTNMMVDELYNYEGSVSTYRHLIGVNYFSTQGLNSVSPNTKISVVNGHYVDLDAIKSPNRLAASEMIRAYNAGPSGTLNRLFGFNEGRITPSNFPGAVGFYVTPESTRSEAWEFMLNGGGAFEHLGYDWNNTLGGTEPARLRTTLGRLATYLKTLDLRRGGRSPLNASAKPTWAPNIPAYGSANGTGNLYWAAYQSPGTYLLYLHHSKLSTHAFKAYLPCLPSGGVACTAVRVPSVAVVMPASSNPYTARWVDPSTGGPIGSTTTWTSTGASKTITAPAYAAHDVMLEIEYSSFGLALPCECAGDFCF